LHEQLKELAATDSLTGLANRRGFLDRLQAEMDRGRRAGKELCVALLDLNQFKIINDAHGHAAGDEVLLCVAETLSEAIRETDVAGRFGSRARAGRRTTDPRAAGGEARRRVVEHPRGGGNSLGAGDRAETGPPPGGARWPRCCSSRSASSSVPSSRSTASRSKSRTSSSRCWWDPRDAARPPASGWSRGWRRRARATSTSASAS